MSFLDLFKSKNNLFAEMLADDADSSRETVIVTNRLLGELVR